jgi:hypothetical protein
MNELDRVLRKAFDESTLERRRSYAHGSAVPDLKDDERRILARVAGTRRTPYKVLVPLRCSSGLPDLPSAVCTCPEGIRCEHASLHADRYTARELDHRPVPGRREHPPFSCSASRSRTLWCSSAEAGPRSVSSGSHHHSACQGMAVTRVVNTAGRGTGTPRIPAVRLGSPRESVPAPRHLRRWGAQS